jgi:SAM-dependent methyltransferase
VKNARILGAALLASGFAAGFVVRAQLDPTPASRAIPTAPAARAATSSVDSGPVAAGTASAASAATQEAFENNNKQATWGRNDAGLGTSGTGSTLAATLVYRTFLAKFMKEHDVHSVVDAGCGDWEFSSTIDWSGIDYRGYDITRDVVARDALAYAKPNIQFFHGDIVEDDLPPADLLLSKHVLQHLPNAAVTKFLAKQLPKYKHVLLTNGVDAKSFAGSNGDIKLGAYRTLDVTAPPFNVPGAKVLTWYDGLDMHQVVHIVAKK